jgi:ankyrin repeat protein
LRSEGYLPKPGLTPFIKAAIWNKSGQLKEMIDAGADLGQVDASGWNALMYAAYNSDSSAMKVLLKAGADPNQTSPHGDTPLIASAVGRSWGDDLVRAGARVNAQNKDGQTALMLLAAIDEVDAIRDALKAGSNPKLKDSKGRTALDYLRLATCRKSPIADPVENWDAEGAKCDAFDPEDVRAVAKLLRNPLQLKEQ